MPKEAKKDNSKLMASICAVVVAVIVIVVAVVMAVTSHKGIDDSYFVSDDTKYVLSMEISEDDIDTEDESAQYAPVKTHVVYDYKDDAITGVRMYYEYEKNEDAKAAYDYLIAAGEGEDYESIYVDGKYIVTVASEDEYKDLTASDVKQSIEFMEALKNMDLEDLYEEEEE